MKYNIQICLGSSCYSRGNADNLLAIKAYLSQHHLEANIDFRGHLCHEICNRGPVIQVNSEIYEEVSPVNLTTILDTHFQAAMTTTDE